MIEKLTCDDAFKQRDGFIMLYHFYGGRPRPQDLGGFDRYSP